MKDGRDDQRVRLTVCFLDRRHAYGGASKPHVSLVVKGPTKWKWPGEVARRSGQEKWPQGGCLFPGVL